MNAKILKYTSILTVILLLLYMFLSVLPGPLYVTGVRAAAIEREDIYKGIGIALFLFLLAELGQSSDQPEEVEIRKPAEADNFSQKEVDLLARVIHAEARGEPYRGQVAVGAVILNRIESTEFPDTIEGVIYQKGQFTSVRNGQINLTPGVSSYNAAYDALDGEDPSYGALYFYNPEKADTLWWLSTREKTAVIGNHIFAR